MKKPGNKKFTTYILIAFLALLIAGIVTSVALRYAVPKMIVRAAIKKNYLNEIPVFLDSLNITTDQALIAIDALTSDERLNAIDALDTVNIADKQQKIDVFINSLDVQNTHSKIILKSLLLDSSAQEVENFFNTLKKNKNKIRFTMPLIRDTIKEAIIQSTHKQE